MVSPVDARGSARTSQVRSQMTSQVRSQMRASRRTCLPVDDYASTRPFRCADHGVPSGRPRESAGAEGIASGQAEHLRLRIPALTD